MKKAIVFSSAALLASTSLQAKVQTIKVEDLREIGIEVDLVVSAFEQEQGINLDLTEEIMVDIDEEGQSIHFETLDKYSIDTPIMHIAGPWNKFLANPI